MDVVFQKWSSKCCVEGDNHFPGPPGYGLVNRAQDTDDLNLLSLGPT